MRAFEMRVVIDLSTGQGQREGFDASHGLQLFVNPVGRTAYHYDAFTRKKVRHMMHIYGFECKVIYGFEYKVVFGFECKVL